MSEMLEPPARNKTRISFRTEGIRVKKIKLHADE